MYRSKYRTEKFQLLSYMYCTCCLTFLYSLIVAEVIDEYTGKVDIECPNPASSSVAELCPLFFQPGKVGYYSIRVGSNTPARINAYRNVGR